MRSCTTWAGVCGAWGGLTRRVGSCPQRVWARRRHVHPSAWHVCLGSPDGGRSRSSGAPESGAPCTDARSTWRSGLSTWCCGGVSWRQERDEMAECCREVLTIEAGVGRRSPSVRTRRRLRGSRVSTSCIAGSGACAATRARQNSCSRDYTAGARAVCREGDSVSRQVERRCGASMTRSSESGERNAMQLGENARTGRLTPASERGATEWFGLCSASPLPVGWH